jgi:hypothetical protein
MKVENLAHQRPYSAFAEGGWYLDTPLFGDSWRTRVLVDENGTADGDAKKEVSRRRESRCGNVFKEIGDKIFPPSVPPHGGRRGTGEIFVVKREL